MILPYALLIGPLSCLQSECSAWKFLRSRGDHLARRSGYLYVCLSGQLLGHWKSSLRYFYCLVQLLAILLGFLDILLYLIHWLLVLRRHWLPPILILHLILYWLSKWSYIHDNLGPVIKYCLDDEYYFQAKYSLKQPTQTTITHLLLSDSRCLSFYDLLYLAYQHTTSSDHVSLVHLAENIQTVQFQTTLQDMPISIPTSKCHFY